MLIGDVARDAAGADDLAGVVPKRDLGGRGPGDAAIGQVLALEFADDRFAGLHNVLLVGEGLLGVLAEEEVEIGLAEDLGVIRDIVKLLEGLVDQKEPPLAILEIDTIGGRVHEGHEEVVIDLGHIRRLVRIGGNQEGRRFAGHHKCHPVVIVRRGH